MWRRDLKMDWCEGLESGHWHVELIDWPFSVKIFDLNNEIACCGIKNVLRVMEKDLLIPVRIGSPLSHHSLLCVIGLQLGTTSILTQITQAPAKLYVAARQTLSYQVITRHVFTRTDITPHSPFVIRALCW